ncbi:MAG: hypothetical protein HYY63_05330 [Elusimicrobia bacterium]|nr:hypothetical protein [Elusimicrobiota bacterium]
MTKKRRVLAGVAVFGILFVSDFLIHGVLLKGTYEATASLWRPMAEMQSLMWTMWTLYFVNAMVLPYIYSKGHDQDKTPAWQGLRFGLLIGLLMSSGMSLGVYLMIPIPATMALTWFIAGMIQFAVVGIAIALIHQPKTVQIQ